MIDLPATRFSRDYQMKRREFIAGLGLTGIGVRSVQAQQPVMPLVGFLSTRSLMKRRYIPTPLAGDGVCNGTTRTRTTRPGSRRLLNCVSAPRARATAISTSRRSRSRSISTQRRRWATATTSSTSHTASVSAVALITFLEGDLLLAPHRAQILQHRSSLFCGVLECAVAERMRPLTIVNIGGSPFRFINSMVKLHGFL